MFKGFKVRKEVKQGVEAYKDVMEKEFNYKPGEGKGFTPLIQNKEYDEKMAEYVDLQNKLNQMSKP